MIGRLLALRAARSLRAVLVSMALAAGPAGLVALAPGSPLVSSCAGAGQSHAALVVEHGDGSVVTRCVAFDTATVTGEWLLNASGISWSGQSFGGFGDAVCALDLEPAHYTDCPGKDYYWAVFVSHAGGAWQLASVGISTLTLGDGDAEGFRYVPSAATPAAPPSPAGVCAAAEASAAATTAAAKAGTPPPVATAPANVAAPSGATAPAGTTGTVAPASATPSPGAPGSAGSAGAGAGASPAALGAPTSGAPGVPPPGSGLDLGLLSAALAGGGLAGLALLRLLASRRSP